MSLPLSQRSSFYVSPLKPNVLSFTNNVHVRGGIVHGRDLLHVKEQVQMLLVFWLSPSSHFLYN